MSGARYFSDQPTREPSMNASHWFRKFHRWVAVLFTLTVTANFAAMTQGQPPAWITYSPLLPLLFLFLTGAWMFVQPYVARHKSLRGSRSI